MIYVDFPQFISIIIAITKGRPFLKCVVSLWALPVRARCKGLPGWFGALFFHICLFDRGCRGSQAIYAFGNAHIEPTHLKNGASLTKKE